VVRITSNDKTFVQINCHRCVLLSHSKKMQTLINGENFWDMDIKVKPGFVAATIELIQYMYLKDISLISEKNKMLELCALFEMPLDYFLLRSDTLEQLNRYEIVQLNIQLDDSSCITTVDLLKRLTFEKAKLSSPETTEKVIEMDEAKKPEMPLKKVYQLRNKRKTRRF